MCYEFIKCVYNFFVFFINFLIYKFFMKYYFSQFIVVMRKCDLKVFFSVYVNFGFFGFFIVLDMNIGYFSLNIVVY